MWCIDHVKLLFSISYTSQKAMCAFKICSVSGWHLICSRSNHSALTEYNSIANTGKSSLSRHYVKKYFQVISNPLQ